MSKMKINPNCAISGCRASQPHLAGKHVAILMDWITNKPHEMVGLIAGGLTDLVNSACNDLRNNNALGFIARLRQIQELYLRGLYLLLLAEPSEQAHMLSGDTPNGIKGYYTKVNDLIFHNQIAWDTELPGLSGDTFTIFETLHEGAHVSFKSLLMARGFLQSADAEKTVQQTANQLNNRLKVLQYIQGMLKSGKSREQVLVGVRALYQPASSIEQQQNEAKNSKDS